MSLTQGFHRAVQQQPDRVALRFQDRQYTFSELSDRVARLAGALQRLGMGRDDRIAMLALNSNRYFEYCLAVPWGGGALNPVNIRWSTREIAYSLNDSGTRILVVDDAYCDQVEAIRRETPGLETVIYAGEGEAPEGTLSYEALIAQSGPLPDAGRGGDDLAGIFYTGGTTGFPKGVCLSHVNMWASAVSIAAEDVARRDSIVLHVAPMFHLAGLGMVLASLIAGSAHVILPAFAPEAIFDAIAEHGITDILMVPTMIQMLVDHPRMGQSPALGSLKSVNYGASPISEALLDRAMAALPGVAFRQLYGLTELAPMCLALPPHYHTPEGRKLGKLRSAGRAGRCVDVRILDEQGREVPRGTVGEIAVRGPNVMQGYWKRPEETAAALRGGWLHTGDGAYMDEEGFVFIVDRLKDMVVTGGENVYSTEVENTVSTHPGVAACAVIGIPSEQWGEAVHAVVVPKAGADITAEQVKAHCAGRIAGYKCPRSVEFRESLPLSGAGKVLKRELRKPYWETE